MVAVIARAREACLGSPQRVASLCSSEKLCSVRVVGIRAPVLFPLGVGCRCSGRPACGSRAGTSSSAGGCVRWKAYRYATGLVQSGNWRAPDRYEARLIHVRPPAEDVECGGIGGWKSPKVRCSWTFPRLLDARYPQDAAPGQSCS